MKQGIRNIPKLMMNDLKFDILSNSISVKAVWHNERLCAMEPCLRL